MGAESGIGDYEPFVISRDTEAGTETLRIPPKVYRECQLCKENVSHFMGRRVVDVTSEYVSVQDVHIDGNESVVENSQRAVFTKGELVPVSSGTKDLRGYVFNDMATNLLYFPILGEHSIEPIGFPIYAEGKKGQKVLQPDYENRISFELRTLNYVPATQIDILSREGYEVFSSLQDRNTESICPVPSHQERYILFVWDDGRWKRVCSSVSGNGTIGFENAPSNAAYVVAVNEEEIKNTRPFIVCNSKLIWL